MYKTFKIEIKWAIIYSIIYIIWSLFERQMGWHTDKVLFHPVYNLLFLPLSIFILILALVDKKRNFYKNDISWKQAFISGIVVTVLITSIYPVVLYIVHNYISPEYFEKAIEATVPKKFTIEEAKAYYNINKFISNSVFDKLSFGIVITACISYFIKTKNDSV